MIKFYGYPKCSTCVKAKKLLKDQGLRFEEIDITIIPPDKKELRGILKAGKYSLNELFNRSGQMYRELDIKSKINRLSEEELLKLLASNGRLVKRPVVIDGSRHTVGLKEEEFRRAWFSGN